MKARAGKRAESVVPAPSRTDHAPGTHAGVEPGPVVPRCVPGLARGEFTLQRSLDVGRCDDPAEVEADRVADQVVAAVHGGASVQQRALPPSGEVSRGAVSGLVRGVVVGPAGGPLTPELHHEIAAARTGGNPLPLSTRQPMERAFGTDLSAVRVHTGPRADALNVAVSARAFTVGNDVFFRGGLPSTADPAGTHLVAHELAHVTQQSGHAQRSMTIRRDGDQLEDLFRDQLRANPHLTEIFADFRRIADFLATPAAVEGAYRDSLHRHDRVDAASSTITPTFIDFVPADFFGAVVRAGQHFLDLVDEQATEGSPHGSDTHVKQWQAIAQWARQSGLLKHDIRDLFKAAMDPVWRFYRYTLWDVLVDNVNTEAYSATQFGSPEKANPRFRAIEEQERGGNPPLTAQQAYQADQAEKTRYVDAYRAAFPTKPQRTMFERVDLAVDGAPYVFTGFTDKGEPTAVYTRASYESCARLLTG